MWAGPVERLHIRRQSRRAGRGRGEGGAREGGRAGRAYGAAGLAATLRPDSTGSGRATGRPRPRPKSGASKRASEAAPRGKSRGPVSSEGARGPVHLLSAARAARPRRPRGPRRARACAVPLPGPQPDPRLRLRRSLGLPGRPAACAAGRGSAGRPGLVWGPGAGHPAAGTLRTEAPGAALAVCFLPAAAEAGPPPQRPGPAVPMPPARAPRTRRGELGRGVADPGPPAGRASSGARAPTLVPLGWDVSPEQAECPCFSRPGSGIRFDVPNPGFGGGDLCLSRSLVINHCTGLRHDRAFLGGSRPGQRETLGG